MSGLDNLQSVQFVTVKGRRFALLDADDWDALVEWLETLEDARITQAALEALKTAGGDRDQAGWIDWESAAL
jgi:hypothetical protein